MKKNTISLNVNFDIEILNIQPEPKLYGDELKKLYRMIKMMTLDLKSGSNTLGVSLNGITYIVDVNLIKEFYV